jgi:hypothetical protein
LLSSVSILAFAGLLGVAGTVPALAVPPAAIDTLTSATPGLFAYSATGFVAAKPSQGNYGVVNAAIISGLADLVADTVTTGTNIGTSNTVTVNTLAAVAAGNTQTNLVSLSSLGTIPTVSDGIAVLAGQVNASPLVGLGIGSATPPTITSSVTASHVFATLNDYTTGTAVVSGNTISASTTGSANSTPTSGVVPTGYVSAALGSNTFSGSTSPYSIVTGTVAISTVQENLDVGQNFGSFANIGGTGATADSITLSIQPLNSTGTSDNENTTGGQVNSNTLSAAYVGNSSNDSIAIGTLSNPTFTGSLALSNVSANYGSGTVTPTPGIAASNIGSTVSATIQDAGVGAGPTPVSDTLTGGLTLTGNTISSSAAGNEALAPAGSTGYGNVISIANGENFVGTHTGSEANTVTIATGVLSASSAADLLLFNSQANAGSAGDEAFTSDTEGGSIKALVDNVSGGSVNLATNTITSTAIGNAATNAILVPGAALGSTALITGTAALSSAQLNSNTPVTANLGTASGGANSITATVGATAGGVATATITNGATVTLTSNSLTAQAFGNEVGNTLDPAATTVGTAPSNPNGPTTLTLQHTDQGGDTVSTATADATINNVQSLLGTSPVTAQNGPAIGSALPGSLIEINASGVTSGLIGTSLSSTLGEIQAVAVGNSAANLLGYDATSLYATGGIANIQAIGESAGFTATSPITATVTNPQVAILAGNAVGAGAGVSSSSLLVASNTLEATAAGNQATNSLNATGNTVTLPSIASPTYSSVIYYNLGSNPPGGTGYAGGLYFDGTHGFVANPATAPSLQGDYDILSSQATNAPVLSQLTGDVAPILIQVGVGGGGTAGNLNGSSANADSNSIIAQAIGNEIASGGNTLTLAATNLTLVPAAYSPLAGITNIQELGTQSGATANINTSGAGTAGAPLFEINIGGNVGTTTGTGVTVSNNTAQALAEGNYAANNTLNVSGNTISDANTGTALTGLTANGPAFPTGTGTINADLALTVVNAQSVAAGDGVTATVQTTAGGGSSASGGYGALINVGGTTVSSSSLAEANNVFVATAIDNNALLNTITITGVNNTSGLASLAVSAGVQNVQLSAADASATLGVPGTPAKQGTSAPGPDNFTGTLTFTVVGSPSVSGGIATLNASNYIEIPITGLDSYQLSALETLIGSTNTLSNAGFLTLNSGTWNYANYELSDATLGVNTLGGFITGGGQGNFNATGVVVTGAQATVPSTVAQIIAVNDPITNSALSITSAPGTQPSGATAISNNANNTLSLAANTISGSSNIAHPNATVDTSGNNLIAAADYAVQNIQEVVGAGPIAAAYETLGITDFPSAGTPTPYGITGSSLTIGGVTIGGVDMGNALQAVSEGNVANNTLALAMTDSGATSASGALLSAQYGAISATQTATSELMAYAPAAIGGTTTGSGSSVTISDNTNKAVAVQNDVTNTVNVTGTNVGGVSGNPAIANYTAASSTTAIQAQGTFTLNNTQDATGLGVSATANTYIYNYDNLLANTSGIVNSSANFDNNVTTAESDANRADVAGGNTLSLSATNLNAPAALVSFQDSGIASSATALSSVTLSLVGGAGAPAGIAANDSNVSVSGNEATATARGNIAINTFTADGSASNGAAGSTAAANAAVTFAPTLTANAGSNTTTNNALTNVQINDVGPVTASSTGTASITLAGGVGGFASAGVVGSSIVLDNNLVTAEADGNVSGNTMTLTGTNLFANGALTSAQVNSATISATATGTVTASVTGGLASVPGTSNSSIDVSGNQTVATARGNSASNALNATPSSNYGTQVSGASSILNSGGVSTATASYALLNAQDNSGNVIATSSATYTVALNSAAASPSAVTGSSANVSGNLIAANAYGNVANNTMTLSALNTGNATAALNSTQVNSGAINASVTGGTIGISVGPTGAANSTFTVGSNSITAHAVGNAAVNVIATK